MEERQIRYKHLFLAVLFVSMCGSLVCLESAGASEDSSAYSLVVVKKKDALIKICNKYLEDPSAWPDIARINNLENPHLIMPGQELVIPIKYLKGVPASGEVTFIKGNVLKMAVSGGEWELLHHGDQVREQSIIKTENESTVEITFEDGATFLVRPDTLLTLENSSKKGSYSYFRRIFQKAGRIISRIRKATGKESRIEIETPSAVSAARGTKFRVAVDNKESTQAVVLEGIIDVEAGGEKVEVHEGEGTFVMKNERPSKPKKLLPPPALIDHEPLYRSLPLEFGFEKIDGGSLYRVMLSRDREFKDIVKEQVLSIDGIMQVVNIDDGTYFLSCRTIDGKGMEGLPSDPAVIKVRINPLPPFIQTPHDNSENRDKSISFKWLKVDGASGYRLEIAKDKAFKSFVQEPLVLQRRSYEISLDYGSYFFRICSFADDGYQGVWSDIKKFSIIPPPPAPEVEKPEMDGKVIHLSWRNLGEGIKYRFQMAADEEFSNLLIEQQLDSPEIVIDRPKKTGKYFVRTSAMDSEGYEGDFSRHQTFEIKRFPYEIPALLIIGLIIGLM